jgi:predicted CxxxxCH...CXXCH cytochrome family protein
LLGVDLDADGDIDARDGDCDVCHQPQWRDTCNYCHGDVDVESGAPPREIDRSTDPETFSFKAHTVHDTAGDSGPAYACSQCHSMPEDILSPGHIVVGDDTPGAAEVDFTGGLAPETAWDGATCSNVYCHGNGQSAAEVEHTAEPMNCDTSCHSGPGSPETDWRAMSGTHQIHLVSRDIRGECAVCHGETVSAEGTIIDMSKHINGRVDHSFTGRGEGVVWEGETCVGGCHYRETSWDLLPPPP